jgi:5-methylcytosine-specific restriction enzyme A
MKPRKTAWMRDELIVALDLYFREDKNPRMAACAEVSSVLRAIPIEMNNLSDPEFREPASVRSKTQNFLALDDEVGKVGRTKGGRLDRDVWKEFSANSDRLRTVAAGIRTNVDSLSPAEAEAETEGIIEASEGAILTRLHRKRERNPKLRATKKKRVLAETGRLACEACDLDFGERYGERGDGFIECHHDRMAHVRKPWLELELIAIQADTLA